MGKGKRQGADRPQELKRKPGLGTVVSLGARTVIDLGISSSVGEVAAALGCATITTLTFVMGGIIMIPQNMVAAEITVACSDDKGFYVWFRGARSGPLASLCGWTTFWGGGPSSYSIMVLALADYIAFLISEAAGIGIKLLATALIMTFMIINIRFVEVGGKFLTFMTSFKMFLFALLTGAGLFYADKIMMSAPAMAGTSIGFKAPPAGVPVTTRSYVGMVTTCSTAGEVKDPKRTTPKALVTTVFVIIAIYTSLAAVVTGLLPMNLLTASSAPMVEAATQIPVIDSAAGVMTVFIIIIVTIVSLHGTIMCQSKIEYAMVKNGLFFRKFAEIHPKWETPTNPIVYSCAMSIVLVFAADIGALSGLFSFVAPCKNAFSFATMFKSYKKADHNPPWKCPAWLLMAILSVGANVVLPMSTFLWAPCKSLFSTFVMVATRLPAYYFWESKDRKKGRT